MNFFSAFIVGCLWLSLTATVLSAEKIRVAFVSPSPTQSPPWIAKETGIFARHGLEAEVLLLTGSPRLVQSLIAGDVDFAVVGITATMRARIRGANVLVLAAATNVTNQKLLVGGKSGIRRLEELKGRVVGVSQYGSEADAFARFAIGRAGLKPDKDVALVQLGGHPQVAAALIAGKIEAGVVGGLATLTAQKAGAVVLASGVDLKAIAPSGTLAASGSYLQRKRDTAMRFMRAYVEAIQFFKTNAAGTIPILQKYLGGITVEQARFLYDDFVELFEQPPVPAQSGLQAILERETDPAAKGFKPSDFVELSFLKEIDRSGQVDKLFRR